jgi:hypothetical protein
MIRKKAFLKQVDLFQVNLGRAVVQAFPGICARLGSDTPTRVVVSTSADWAANYDQRSVGCHLICDRASSNRFPHRAAWGYGHGCRTMAKSVRNRPNSSTFPGNTHERPLTPYKAVGSGPHREASVRIR